MPLEPSPRKGTPLPTQTNGIRGQDISRRQRELRREDSGVIPSTISMPSSSPLSSTSSYSIESTTSSWDVTPHQHQDDAAHQSSNYEGSDDNDDNDNDDYDDKLSPVFASPSSPPKNRRPHSSTNARTTPPSVSPPPELSLSPQRSPQGLRSSVGLLPLKRKKKPPPKKTRKDKEPFSDSDPIMDFESDDDVAATTTAAGRHVASDLSDEVILHSLAVPATPTKRRHPITAFSPMSGRAKNASPSSNIDHRLQLSPGRLHFQRPVNSTMTSTNRPGPPSSPPLLPASPTKRMRLVSELPRLLAPTLTTVPSSSDTTAATATKTTNMSTSTSRPSTPTTPTRKLTEIARTLQKPAPVGPKLNRIAEEIRAEQEKEAEDLQHRKGMESGKNKDDSSSDGVQDGVKTQRPQRLPPLSPTLQVSASANYDDFYLSFPPTEKDQEKDQQREEPPRLPSSSSSTSAAYLGRSVSPHVEPPSFVYNVKDLMDRSKSEDANSSQEQEQEKHQQLLRDAKERKKQELLSEVQAMRRPQKSMPPPALPPARPLAPPPPPSAVSSSPPTMTSTASSTVMTSTITRSHQLPPPPPPPPPSTPIGHHGDSFKNGMDSMIPIPDLVLEYAPKLTSIDQINRPPAREGRFHIFTLIIAIEPMEVIAGKSGGGANGNNGHGNGGGSSFQKVLVSVCDQSATSFKVVLWRDKADWINHFKPGDAILFTDLQMKDYRNKISGNSSAWSKFSRMDGSVLARYKGPRNLAAASTAIESRLKIFQEKRRVLALDLLDLDKGIARPSSFYLSAPMSLLDQLLQHQDQEQEQEPSRPPRSTTGTSGTSGIVNKFSSDCLKKTVAKTNMTSTIVPISARHSSRPTTTASSSLSTATNVATIIAATSTSSSSSSAISLNRPNKNGVAPPTAEVTGTSIRASVVYRMLIVPNDESAGWEVGAVMSNGRFVKVQSTLNASTWIQNAAPGRLLKFFGQFVKQNDGSTIFSLDQATRDPDSIAESGWGNIVKNIELKVFRSIRALHGHRFMGDAILEETTISAVHFPNLTNHYNLNDKDPDAMFSFIKCYCRDCGSLTESSPQNPSILYCPYCHLHKKSSLEWYYPPFQMTLMDSNKQGKHGVVLSPERLQVRCQMELGDQVFSSVPAANWVMDGDVAKFWKCKEEWTQTMRFFNGSDNNNKSQINVRVEIRVGLNFVTKALALRYLL